MPELPEVETICRGLASLITNQKIVAVTIYNFKLRYPIPKNLTTILAGQVIQKISRRGKYILLTIKNGTLIIHLGMSGTLQIKNKNHVIAKHEHLNIILTNNLVLCYNDPRRFGSILWTPNDPLTHHLLNKLGPEPFARNFTAKLLVSKAQTKKCTIKQFLMNNEIVTGIGNIYANEILFAAKINPLQPAALLSHARYQKLIRETKRILTLAIKHGGTTIKDHTDSSGKQGLFQEKLKVYGKANHPCPSCHTTLTTIKLGQRTTIFCPSCQN